MIKPLESLDSQSVFVIFIHVSHLNGFFSLRYDPHTRLTLIGHIDILHHLVRTDVIHRGPPAPTPARDNSQVRVRQKFFPENFGQIKSVEIFLVLVLNVDSFPVKQVKHGLRGGLIFPVDDVFEDTVQKDGRYLILTQFSEYLLLEILCITYLMCRREQITLDEVHLV